MKISNNQVQKSSQPIQASQKAHQQSFTAVNWGKANGTKRFINEKFALFGDPEGWAKWQFLMPFQKLTVRGKDLILNIVESDAGQKISLRMSGKRSPVVRHTLNIPELSGYKAALEEQIPIMAKQLKDKLS